MKTSGVHTAGEAPVVLSIEEANDVAHASTANSAVPEDDQWDDQPANLYSLRYRDIMRNAYALRHDTHPHMTRAIGPTWEGVASEKKFITAPTVRGFLSLEHDFKRTMMMVGHEKYLWVNDITINETESLHPTRAASRRQARKDRKLERWHRRTGKELSSQQAEEEEKAARRRCKIEEEGKGFGGKATKVVGKAKATSFYVKNNLTIRGNVFKLGHQISPKNIYEIMPRFGYRKGAHIGVRVAQFTLTTIATALGYGLIPVTFGVSKIVADHTRTLITLTGEVITHKIAGASKDKCILHASLRGVQLEVPRLIPIAGDVVNIGEGIVFGTAAVGIVSTTIADALLAHISERYTSTLNADDLGDSRCLAELNSRIDYLAQFLLPYGQYLLLKEADLHERAKLKKVLKANFSLLRDLEKKKVNSLTYYRLALAAEKIPELLRETIRHDVEGALPDTRVNTHRIVKQCLAALVAQDPQLSAKADVQMQPLDEASGDIKPPHSETTALL